MPAEEAKSWRDPDFSREGRGERYRGRSQRGELGSMSGPMPAEGGGERLRELNCGDALGGLSCYILNHETIASQGEDIGAFTGTGTRTQEELVKGHKRHSSYTDYINSSPSIPLHPSRLSRRSLARAPRGPYRSCDGTWGSVPGPSRRRSLGSVGAELSRWEHLMRVEGWMDGKVIGRDQFAPKANLR